MNPPFGKLQELRNTPIPNLTIVRDVKRKYREHPFDHDESMNHASDELVDIHTQGINGSNFYYTKQNPPYHECIPGSMADLLLRPDIIERLKVINQRLAYCGLELFVFDAWRPAAVQNYLAMKWFPAKLRTQHPDWTEKQVSEEAANYWAPGPALEREINPLSPPPHSTGAAFDLTIRWINGESLWMGTIFDDASKKAHTDALEQGENNYSFSDEEARQNRRLLYWLMKEAGFANNPTEWWHYSYGDQMWAKLISAEKGEVVLAIYSSIEPSPYRVG